MVSVKVSQLILLGWSRPVGRVWGGVRVYGESLLRIRFRDAASMLCVAQREGG